MIATMTELSAYLADAQAQYVREVRCELTADLSARVNDAALIETLIIGLPMAQGVKTRLIRRRGRGIVLTAKVRYRDGVRMLSGDALSKSEITALKTAQDIVTDFLSLGEEERFRRVYRWICGNISYMHTAPGKNGYENLVGAAGVLQARQANCQGFADVVYLLCGLCGIDCVYRTGRGEKQLHVWNAVRLGGEWHEVDASKGARFPDA